jgi:predicted PurR-regulated permease PerM
MTEQRESAGDRVLMARTLETVIRLGLIAAMIALCLWIMHPFLIVILWGLIIAIAAWPGYAKLLGWLGERRLLASSIFTALALLLLLLPILMLSGTLVEGVTTTSKSFHNGEFDIPPPPDLSALPVIGQEIEEFWGRASANLEETLRSIQPQLQKIAAHVLSVAANAGIGMLHFLLAIVIAAILLAKSDDGRRLADAIAQRLAGDQGLRFARLAESVVRSVSRGVLGIALIQALLGGVGMLVAEVPAAGLWALLIMILATVQIGAFPVLLLVSLYLFYSADLPTAILFAIWSVVVSSLDNLLKPLLLGRGVEVPMAVIFIGAIGGLLNAGIIGLFIGPVILALGYELFLAWLKQTAPEISAPGITPAGISATGISRPGGRSTEISTPGMPPTGVEPARPSDD